jgi:hypothetical protein
MAPASRLFREKKHDRKQNDETAPCSHKSTSSLSAKDHRGVLESLGARRAKNLATSQVLHVSCPN